jgi:phage host-nuclease inhibitor protein Gam
MSPANKNPTTTGYEEPRTGGSVLPSEAERRLKEDAGAVVEAAKQEFGTVKAEAEAQAGAVVEQAKHEIGKAAEKAKGMATEQKEFIAHQVDDVAQAVNKVAGELEMNNAAIGGYARTVADTVTNFSETIKNKDVDELLGMAQDFGRRQPAAFMGAMALMGFAASRFIMASAQRNRMPAMGDQYASTDIGDGGIAGNYPGPSRRRSGETSASPTDTMGGSI